MTRSGPIAVKPHRCRGCSVLAWGSVEPWNALSFREIAPAAFTSQSRNISTDVNAAHCHFLHVTGLVLFSFVHILCIRSAVIDLSKRSFTVELPSLPWILSNRRRRKPCQILMAFQIHTLRRPCQTRMLQLLLPRLRLSSSQKSKQRPSSRRKHLVST